ncbi:hypothetical protein [Paenibacillus sp. 1P07SE]|uniref:hypothetical protein n=1 Tax=Paenibacillus sp. 1P07SE TaxID=3132209 RepID=UPI0039A5B14E
MAALAPAAERQLGWCRCRWGGGFGAALTCSDPFCRWGGGSGAAHYCSDPFCR